MPVRTASALSSAALCAWLCARPSSVHSLHPAASAEPVVVSRFQTGVSVLHWQNSVIMLPGQHQTVCVLSLVQGAQEQQALPVPRCCEYPNHLRDVVFCHYCLKRRIAVVCDLMARLVLRVRRARLQRTQSGRALQY